MVPFQLPKLSFNDFTLPDRIIDWVLRRLCISHKMFVDLVRLFHEGQYL